MLELTTLVGRVCSQRTLACTNERDVDRGPLHWQHVAESIRSKDDWAITVILHSDFERFLIQNQDILPDWWKAAIEFK